MNTTLIVILIAIYTVFAMFSFKLVTLGLPSVINDYLYADNKFLRHSQQKHGYFWDIVFNSGVCQFGKFGIIVLIIWSIILSSLLIFYKKDNRNTVLKVLGSINLLFFFVYGLLTYMMNWPLFVRCIPYLLIQLTVSILIFYL